MREDMPAGRSARRRVPEGAARGNEKALRGRASADRSGSIRVRLLGRSCRSRGRPERNSTKARGLDVRFGDSAIAIV